MSAVSTPSTIGVLKSTDGGVTWNATGLHYTLTSSGPGYQTVNQLAINPNNTQIIFAATSFGLFYTANAGLSWFSVQSGNFKSVEFEPSHPAMVYASTYTGGFYRSTNGGISFTSVALPTSSGVGRLQIAVTPADSNYVYVLGENASNNAFFGLWFSKDDGQTFTLESTTPNVLGFSNGTGSDATEGQGWYTLSIAASPTSASTVLVGGVNIWMSTNNGASWTKKSSWTNNPYVHADIHSIIFPNGSGTTIYTGCDGGVYASTNTGTSWTDYSSGLEIAQQYSIGPSASVATEWLTGWQDNGTNISTSGWAQVIGGDGMICFIDNTNNNYMYGETYEAGFEVSNNGGATFNNATTGITENGPWVTPWVQDPKASATIFAGLNNVWKSTNHAASWTKISTFGNTSTSIDYVAVAPSNDQYIYASITSGLYATNNGGSTWTNITGSLPASSVAITYIAVDPANPSRLWVTLSGYSGGVKVYQTSNYGTTWVNISNGLPNLPVNTIAYQGGGIDAMYVGTDMGVYYRDTTTTGGNWVDYNNGLPNVEVFDLKIYAPGNLLDAATYGRGTWQIPLYTPATSAPVANFTAFPTSICAGNAIQFTDTSSNEPTSWSWTFAGGTPATSTSENPIVSYSSGGKFLVTMVAKNGIGQDSIAKTSYVTVFPPIIVPSITQITGTDTLTCTPSNYLSYQWFKSNTALVGATSSQYIVSATGIYKVDVTDSNGCTVTVSKTVSVLGVNEISLNDFIKVYPNPANGEVSVLFDMPTAGEYTLALTDVLGQTMYTNRIHVNGQYTQKISLAGYSKGVYFLSVSGTDSKGVQKILVY
jgi:PKD repeat protein